MVVLPERLGFMRGLGFRLGALLSIAILPIGLISLMQTLSLSSAAERNAELALLGRTSAAAAGERALILSAMGTADALGPAVLENLNDDEACRSMMQGFTKRTASYVSAAYVPLDGIARCTSGASAAYDMRSTVSFQNFAKEPGVMVGSTDHGLVSGQPVVKVAQPLYRGTTLLGYVEVAMSRDLLRSTHDLQRDEDSARVVTFNAAGMMLSSDRDQPFDEVLPAGATIHKLLSRTDTTFRALSKSGESRIFSVVPVVPGLVYALGSWSPKQSGVGYIQLSRWTAVLFPLALWAVSLGVAYFAVFRLVLRHVRELRSQMRRFAIGNRAEPPPVLTGAPAEIADMSRTFHDMARILIRDEEAMENAVTEKTVLLKEVHHRVKNNLQLIASIINMQSRMIYDSDAKRVLRSVQDRVASLATIYRNLYQAEHLDSVDADRLITDIINQMSNLAGGTGIRVETELERLTLLPDQAVPLSLLTTEAFTNALKYAGPPAPGEPAVVRVALTRTESGRARLRVANTVGNRVSHDAESTGLGSQLIEAFATQLNGEAIIISDEHEFALSLDFVVDEVSPSSEEWRVVLTSASRPGAQH